MTTNLLSFEGFLWIYLCGHFGPHKDRYTHTHAHYNFLLSSLASFHACHSSCISQMTWYLFSAMGLTLPVSSPTLCCHSTRGETQADNRLCYILRDTQSHSSTKVYCLNFYQLHFTHTIIVFVVKEAHNKLLFVGYIYSTLSTLPNFILNCEIKANGRKYYCTWCILLMCYLNTHINRRLLLPMYVVHIKKGQFKVSQLK